MNKRSESPGRYRQMPVLTLKCDTLKGEVAVKTYVLLFLLISAMVSGVCFAQGPKEEIAQAYRYAHWDDLSIEVREVRAEPVAGFVPMKLKNVAESLKDTTYYVAAESVLTIRDIAGIEVFYSPHFIDKLGLVLIFNKEAKQTLKEYSRSHIGEFMGVIIDGALIDVTKILETIDRGRLTVIEFEPQEAVSISERFYRPLQPIWQYIRYPNTAIPRAE